MRQASAAEALREGERILTICNACRYCEGYCAVFPALERRTSFAAADLKYLANLCHHCAECYYACQYAPPHEFAVNVPKILAEIRARSYRQYAWPNVAFGKAAFLVATAIAVAIIAWGTTQSGAPSDARFYAVIPHRVMVAVFGGASLLVALALAIGLRRFWRESGSAGSGWGGIVEAAADAFRLTYLYGQGEGCTYPRERRSLARWWFHHFTLYGFLLCFAATALAAIYHYGFGWIAPYDLFSWPVLLGTLGGIGLLVGPAGLLWLRRLQDSATREANESGMATTFLVLLFLTSASGLLLLAFRSWPAMRPLLVLHLAIVMALFLTLPYGKFVHGIYRLAALTRYAQERSREKADHATGR